MRQMIDLAHRKGYPRTMFSGIIESIEPILESRSISHAHEITVKRPIFFDDIKIGDSIAVNGVCLTLESFTSEQMKFTLGFETLKIIGSSFSQWLAYPVNLERSLAFGARVHGHFVTGHVESMVQILKSESFGDNWLITIQLDEVARKYCWKKGSITLNGVSLTINAAETGNIEVCLIPETQKRTNLNLFKVGEKLSFEPDSFAKAILEAVTHSNFFSGGKNV